MQALTTAILGKDRTKSPDNQDQMDNSQSPRPKRLAFELNDLIVNQDTYHFVGDACKVSLPIELVDSFERGGKWLLFPNPCELKSTWEKVLLLLAARRLGYQVKIKADNNVGSYVICVYTYDYQDLPDVLRVLTALWRNRLANSCNKLKYKTNEATIDGLFGSHYAAQRAGFIKANNKEMGKRSCIYFSPKPNEDVTGATEEIQIFMTDVGPKREVSLVAQLHKQSHNTETKTTFYDPPIINRSSSLSSDAN